MNFSLLTFALFLGQALGDCQPPFSDKAVRYEGECSGPSCAVTCMYGNYATLDPEREEISLICKGDDWTRDGTVLSTGVTCEKPAEFQTYESGLSTYDGALLAALSGESLDDSVSRFEDGCNIASKPCAVYCRTGKFNLAVLTEITRVLVKKVEMGDGTYAIKYYEIEKDGSEFRTLDTEIGLTTGSTLMCEKRLTSMEKSQKKRCTTPFQGKPVNYEGFCRENYGSIHGEPCKVVCVPGNFNGGSRELTIYCNEGAWKLGGVELNETDNDCAGNFGVQTDYSDGPRDCATTRHLHESVTKVDTDCDLDTKSCPAYCSKGKFNFANSDLNSYVIVSMTTGCNLEYPNPDTDIGGQINANDLACTEPDDYDERCAEVKALGPGQVVCSPATTCIYTCHDMEIKLKCNKGWWGRYKENGFFEIWSEENQLLYLRCPELGQEVKPNKCFQLPVEDDSFNYKQDACDILGENGVKCKYECETGRKLKSDTYLWGKDDGGIYGVVSCVKDSFTPIECEFPPTPEPNNSGCSDFGDIDNGQTTGDAYDVGYTKVQEFTCATNYFAVPSNFNSPSYTGGVSKCLDGSWEEAECMPVQTDVETNEWIEKIKDVHCDE